MYQLSENTAPTETDISLLPDLTPHLIILCSGTGTSPWPRKVKEKPRSSPRLIRHGHTSGHLAPSQDTGRVVGRLDRAPQPRHKRLDTHEPSGTAHFSHSPAVSLTLHCRSHRRQPRARLTINVARRHNPRPQPAHGLLHGHSAHMAGPHHHRLRVGRLFPLPRGQGGP